MATRFVYAMARMPGCDGEDSDATGAYTQCDLGDDCPTTWITLPKNRWPKEWFDIYTDEKDPPVVILQRNVYGHPRAGYYWEKYCAEEKQIVPINLCRRFQAR